jgi:hypothetical protein
MENRAMKGLSHASPPVLEKTMKRNNPSPAIAVANGTSGDGQESKHNGSSVVVQPGSSDLSVILASLQTMRDGDFSVRLPGSWTGLAGKIGIPSIPSFPRTNRWQRN